MSTLQQLHVIRLHSSTLLQSSLKERTATLKTFNTKALKLWKRGNHMGYIYLYTGTGGGKTTNALGLALRTVGHKRNVIIIQFM
jgi:ATP:corrinoid adenosyltransferase